MPIREATVEQLDEARRASDGTGAPRILDVRTEGEHAIASLSGALLIPLHELNGRVGELAEEGWGHDDPVFVLCHHGVRSRTGAAILQGMGFQNVASVTGGIEAWSLRVDPAVPRYS